MAFTKKTPEYNACVKFIEAISLQNKTTNTNIIDLTSPTEDETMDNSMGILFVNQKNIIAKRTQEKDDEQLQDYEERGTNIDAMTTTRTEQEQKQKESQLDKQSHGLCAQI